MAAEFSEDDQFMDEASKKADKTEDEIEKDDKIKKEEKEELQKDVEKIKKTTKAWDTVKSEFKKATEPDSLRTAAKFFVGSTVTAVIFFFVTLGLKKGMGDSSSGGGGSSGGSGDEEKKRKAAVLSALSEVSKDVQEISRLLSVWFTAHEAEKIQAGEFHVPLVDIFSDYTTDMATELDAISKNSKTLTSNDNGQLVFSIPSLVLVNTILTHYGNYIAILPKLLKFAQEKANTYDTVKTFPLKQSDIDTVTSDYDAAKKLPY